MATIKSYTDLSQSKTLSKILPLESADMYYDDIIDEVTGELFIPNDGSTIMIGKGLSGSIAAWSLAALLNILPSVTLDSSNDHHYRVHCNERFTDWHDNSVDACVAMIEKLNELKML